MRWNFLSQCLASSEIFAGISMMPNISVFTNSKSIGIRYLYYRKPHGTGSHDNSQQISFLCLLVS